MSILYAALNSEGLTFEKFVRLRWKLAEKVPQNLGDQTDLFVALVKLEKETALKKPKAQMTAEDFGDCDLCIAEIIAYMRASYHRSMDEEHTICATGLDVVPTFRKGMNRPP